MEFWTISLSETTNSLSSRLVFRLPEEITADCVEARSAVGDIETEEDSVSVSVSTETGNKHKSQQVKKQIHS